MAYVRAPRARLLALRFFVEEGKATPPAGDVLERLFSGPPPSRPPPSRGPVSRASRPVPKEIVWHVLKFWRCDRDYAYSP
jgi:hypothetical protein